MRGAAIATVLAQIIAFVICFVYMFKKYEILRLTKSDFTALDGNLVRNMLGSGLSMGFMSSLVNIGSLTLQTAINKLGQDNCCTYCSKKNIRDVYDNVYCIWADDGYLLRSEYGGRKN